MCPIRCLHVSHCAWEMPSVDSMLALLRSVVVKLIVHTFLFSLLVVSFVYTLPRVVRYRFCRFLDMMCEYYCGR